jgi:hypothetical protein
MMIPEMPERILHRMRHVYRKKYGPRFEYRVSSNLEDFEIQDARIAFGFTFETGSFGILYYRKDGSTIEPPKLRRGWEVGDLTLCFIWNDHYEKQMKAAKEYFRSHRTVFVYMSDDEFSVAKARNKAVQEVQTSHLLMLDLDARLNVDRVVQSFNNDRHCGILNPRCDEIGSGSSFILCKPHELHFDERFTGMNCEDAAMLMGFARIGRWPHITSCGLTFAENDKRGHRIYSHHAKNNEVLFREMILEEDRA